MEALTTIKRILAGNRIFVPSYQRAYSWETEIDSNKSPKQTNTFLSDLEDYTKSSTKSKYYFGHFLFEKKQNDYYGVIDGQQRLTTIVIFLSALFARLKTMGSLKNNEAETFEDTIRRNSSYRFATVDYDNQLFKDYVIDQIKKNNKGLDTESAKRIVKAFDFFVAYLSDKDVSYLSKLLTVITEASCTTHLVTDESEAIQMFIFQNNRGKKPSNLELLKAQFMYNIHIYGGEEKENLINEIKNRFEKIYKSISSIEHHIDEDEVLVYTLRIYFNSLWESNALDKINKILSDGGQIDFIQSFTNSLSDSFEYMVIFFGKDERENIEIHSLVTLGNFSIAIPFIIKAYSFGLTTNEICTLCTSLESIVLRHRLVGTRADIISRINDVYKEFVAEQPALKPIFEKIEWIKNAPSESWWWAYWNKSELERSIQGGIHHATAKYLLWKYENHLENQGKSGYIPTRFDKIESPELEHIAPNTATNGEPVAAGYCEYDEEFKQQYVDCLGNYLLVSQHHNRSIGNKPFTDKRSSYEHLAQQREIKQMTIEKTIWTKEHINKRKSKIIDFILNTF